MFNESEVGDLSLNILQDNSASINTFENSLNNNITESQTLIEKDVEIYPAFSLLSSENESEKKKAKKKEEIKAKLHEVKSKFAKEQEMSKVNFLYTFIN